MPAVNIPTLGCKAAVIGLMPMNAEQFKAYIEEAIPAYARAKVDSGQWSEETSLALSRQGFDELLPEGLATPDHFLFTLQEPASQATIGMLWYAIQQRAGQRVAYVYDVLVEPEYRRNGHGTRAFEALEMDVASRGLHGIALHVFGHNTAAQALYAKLGYLATNINLFKPVSIAAT